jgi:hypothetical protein
VPFWVPVPLLELEQVLALEQVLPVPLEQQVQEQVQV